MFKTEIIGPVLYATYSNIHFIGELHNINGPPSNSGCSCSYVLQQIMKPSSRKIELIIEASVNDLHVMARGDGPLSPLKQLARIIRTHKQIPDNVNIILANIRNDAPFQIFEAIYNFEGFIDITLAQGSSDYVQLYRSKWKAAKLFEKEFLNRVAKTRIGCTKFFKSLVHPDFLYPPWFEYHLAALGISATENKLKITLRQMRETNIPLFENVMGIIGSMFTTTVLDNTEYSPAMQAIVAKRQSGSKDMVIERWPLVQTFWISINSIFMDAFTICKIFEASQQQNDVVVLTGVNHIINILQHFDKKSIRYVYNETGRLRLADMVSGAPPPVAKSPTSLLRNFNATLVANP